MRGELLKGHLDLLLLAIVAGGPLHGYAIIDELRSRSGGAFDLPEGTVYPALHRLERNGLLVSRWADGTNRRRRVYSLSVAGRAALAARAQDWQQFSRSVDAVVKRTPCLNPA
jgi:PadR family transcriptional regulator PadR